MKEKVRNKQKEDEESRRVKADSKRLTEMTRAEKNKAWRMRQEEKMMNNWREVECRVRGVGLSRTFQRESHADLD